MPSVSAYAGSVGTANVSAGTFTWTTTSNAIGSPTASYATTTSGMTASSAETQSIDLYNFAPGLPGGSTVTGCEITIQALYSEPIGTNPPKIQGCQLELNSVTGTPTTTNAVGTSISKTVATYQFGSSTDLWGIASGNWTVANVNSATENTGPTFSVWFELPSSSSHPVSPEINGIQITITYTTGGGGNSGGLTPMFNTSAVWSPMFSPDVLLYDPFTGL